MLANPQVALCFDNVQIEGTVSFCGHPLNSSNCEFAELFKANYKGSFDLYTALADEVLVKITLRRATLWKHENKRPYREMFDFENAVFEKVFYKG